MTIYAYETSKIIIHNIHNEKEIEIEYLRLIFYCVNILKKVPSLGTQGVLLWYPGRIVMVPRAYCHGSQEY